MSAGRAKAARAPLAHRGRLARTLRRGRFSYFVAGGGCCGVGAGLPITGSGSPQDGVPLLMESVPPNRADVLVVAGSVNAKMAHELRALYDAMPHPKWVVAVGSCACGSGPFAAYANVVADVGTVIPVDVKVEGCPPSADAIRAALGSLRDIAARKSEADRASRG